MARTRAVLGLVRALRGAAHAGEPGLGAQAMSVPRLVRSTWRGEYRGMTRGRLATLFLGVLYVASPVDLIPEAVLPIVGLADDAVVLAWLASALLGATGPFLRWERSGRRPAGRGYEDQANVVQGEVLH